MKQKFISFSFFFLLAFSLITTAKAAYVTISYQEDVASFSLQIDQIYHHSKHASDRIELAKMADFSSEVNNFSATFTSRFSNKFGTACHFVTKKLFPSFQISKTPIYILVQCFRN